MNLCQVHVTYRAAHDQFCKETSMFVLITINDGSVEKLV